MWRTLMGASVVTVHNAEIAQLFNRYATLLEIAGENPFRIRAYRNAARTIEGLPRDVSAMLGEGFDLSDLPGIGDDLAHKISDIVATEKFAQLDSIKKKVPAALAELTAVPGLGPKRIKVLFDKLKVKSVDDLAAAVRAGRLDGLHGFGPTIKQAIIKAASERTTAPKRMLLSQAEHIAEPLVAWLKAVPGAKHVVLAGSYRRRRETVGDLDVLVTCAKGAPVIERFASYGEVAEILASGTTRASVRLKSGLQVDLRVVPQKSFGAALLYFTGSKAHNIALRAMGLKHGLKVNEYGVFRKDTPVAGKTEAEVYAQFGLAYIEPELRENEGEVEAAREGRLPELVTLRDIKGDLHVHTRESDGAATILAMAEAAKARGHSYLAICDHASRIGVTHGLDAKRLARQMAEIDRLNAKLKGLTILKSAEVDILPDGSLALEDAILNELDLVTASIHAKFDLPAAKQTERLIRAMDHRCVNIIGHPTGRLIGEREPYALDLKRLLAAAKQRGCCLELNAQPMRLDLSDHHVRLAKDMGVKIAISTDAHSPETLDYMRFGIDQARRGWLESEDVLNALPLAALRRQLER